jgi:type VI secretion system protein ImpL
VPLVDKWQRILLELQKYQSNNPRNSISTLENFIRFDLAQVTRSNCVDQLSGERFAATGDYFLDRRDALRQSLLAQCSVIATSTGVAGYARLADRFNDTLAGRYPFAEAAPGNDAAEAPLDAVIAYLQYFAANAPAVETALAAGATPGQQDALAFLEQMDKVRAFFAPFLVPGAAQPPGYDVAVDFRVNRRFEAGADQIIEWELTIGDHTFERGQPAQPTRWHLSDPITVNLRWAKDGPISPVIEGVANQEEFKKRVVSWHYDDRWALLRLLLEHRPPPEDLDPEAAAVPQVLEFTAQTVPVIGPATRSPGPVGEAKAFIRVRLSALPPGGKVPVALALPDFPTRAPTLSREAMQ